MPLGLRQPEKVDAQDVSTSLCVSAAGLQVTQTEQNQDRGFTQPNVDVDNMSTSLETLEREGGT